MIAPGTGGFMLSSFIFISSFFISQNSGEPDSTKWNFVGCAWDVGECFMSCENQNRKRKAVEDPELCTDERLPYACYCEIIKLRD
jgi:hypothetical protein